MADLNKILNNIQNKTSSVEESVQTLLAQYDDLFRESTKLFNEERTASDGKMDGLEDFYRMVQTIRRNRDVIGSITRGIKSIRPINQFKIIEEDDRPHKTPTPKGKGPKGPSPVLNEQSIQNLQIPTEEQVTNA
jgi:hypothetical protein